MYSICNKLPFSSSSVLLLFQCVLLAIYLLISQLVTYFFSFLIILWVFILCTRQLCFKPGVPNLKAMDQYYSRPVRNWTSQQEVSLNVTHLNYHETIPITPVCGKIVFHETGPWCQKGWGPCRESYLILIYVSMIIALVEV